MATTLSLVLLMVGCLTVITVSVAGQKKKVEVMDELCIGCICEAATNCNRTRQCRNGVCGLFAITRPYWEDAGMAVIPGDDKNRPGAFERCVTEPFCASRTVQEYMGKYPEDCDKNGIINCHDYAVMHVLGRGCEGTLSAAYMKEFTKCQRRVVIK